MGIEWSAADIDRVFLQCPDWCAKAPLQDDASSRSRDVQCSFDVTLSTIMRVHPHPRTPLPLCRN
eukprot:3456934-Pleurochrysis_carterae.AAC.1